MSSKYQEPHYEDVGRLLRENQDAGKGCPIHGDDTRACLAYEFTNLFAADNPPVCRQCQLPYPASPSCQPGYAERNAEGLYDHAFAGGFDRERFLKACGLEEG